MKTTRVIIASLLATGCNELREVGEGGVNGGIPTRVQQAFDESCAEDGCHDATNAQAGLDLTAAAAPRIIEGSSTGGIPMVTVGDVCSSYMAIKLIPPGESVCDTPIIGTSMPAGEVTQADQENVAVILGWIAGADLPGGGGETGPDAQMCGVSDVSMGALSTPVISSDSDPMTIPTDVGDVITRNCGCHLVDDPMDFIPPVGHYDRNVPLRTWAEIHADHPNTMAPWYESIRFRVVAQASPVLVMPQTAYCMEQDVGAMSQADYDILSQWLNDDAPDAPTWTPP